MGNYLKIEYKDSILGNVVLQAMIAQITKRSIETVKRWVRENDSTLLNFQVLELLKNQHGLENYGDLLTDRKPRKVKKEKAVA